MHQPPLPPRQLDDNPFSLIPSDANVNSRQINQTLSWFAVARPTRPRSATSRWNFLLEQHLGYSHLLLVLPFDPFLHLSSYFSNSFPVRIIITIARVNFPACQRTLSPGKWSTTGTREICNYNRIRGKSRRRDSFSGKSL